MNHPRVRIEDVAKLARVSTATVSRALSNPDIVKVAKREAVLAASKQLGYVPDAAARALASGKTSTVGCVVPSLDQAIFAKSTQSLQVSLAEQGYQVLIASHDYDLRVEYDVMMALVRRGVDALVLVGTDHLPKTWAAIKALQRPVLLSWSCDQRLVSVGFDNHAVGQTLADHLLDLGHRRIGVISGLMQHNDRARSRIEGVRAALAKRRLKLTDDLISEQAFSLRGGAAGLQALMALNKPPTALLCGNDLLATGALLQAQRMNIRVPEQLSICGIDNQEMSREINPSLTTVNMPTADLGRICALQLVAALSGKTIERQLLLPFNLLVRQSTAAPLA